MERQRRKSAKGSATRRQAHQGERGEAVTTFATEAKAGQRGKVDEGEGQDLKEGDAAKESARVVRQTRLGSGETAACSSRREIGSKPLCNADVDKEITRLKQLLARLEMKSLPRNAVEILERAIILLESPAPGDTAEDLLDDASNSWKAFKKQLLPTAMTPEEDVVVDLVASKLSGPLVELLLSVEERGSKSLESLLGEAGSRARAERRRKREEVAASAITKNAYEWCEARRLAKRRTRTATKKWAPALGALEALTASKTALCLEDWRETVERAPLPSFSVGPLSANFDEAASLRIVAVEERFSEGEDSGSETSIEQEDEEEKDCEAEDVGKECQPKRERPAFWTKHALDWMRSADPKWREMLVKRVGRIVEGERTYAVAKALKGTKRCKLFEAKLDSGMRIIWSESPAIVIWFVVKHDAVSKICRLIDDSERRKISPRVERNDAEIKGPLVDPLSNALLPCYRVQYEDLDRLSKDWQPPFALADDERQLVDSSAMSAILLLGRSGTGKTVCTAMRMSRMAPVASRQLFVARSHRLCQHVRRLLDASAVGDDCEGQSTAETLDLDTFVERMWTHVGHPPTRRREEERRRRRVTYDVFRDRVFQSDKGGIKPLEAWTQIRCFIKGSAEAVLKGRRLEGDEFAANAAFNNRSRLDASGRREALDICDRYDAFLDDHCSLFWDDSDRVRNIASAALLRRRRPRRYEALCDRIYVDECQDLTQAHIILALLAVGGDPSRLWLAGDTAQCVAYGSHFRFADVRSAIHAVVGVSDKLVTNGASAQVKYVAPKVFKLTTNYRTHSGVMSLSARIISCILATFPDTSVDRMLNPESNNFALVRGPLPAFAGKDLEKAVVDLLARDERFVILTHDDIRDQVERRLCNNNKNALVLGIRDAKGLEFDSVICYNLVSASPSARRETYSDVAYERAMKKSSWSHALQTTGNNSKYAVDVDPELEAELMLLYTAVTRCRSRLIVCECGQNAAAAQAVERWLFASAEDDVLASRFVPQTRDTDYALSSDEWRTRAVDLMHAANECDDADTSSLLYDRAAAAFSKAGDESLVAAARGARIERRTRARLLDTRSNEGGDSNVEPTVLSGIADCLQAGSIHDAIGLCKLIEEQSIVARQFRLLLTEQFMAGVASQLAASERDKSFFAYDLIADDSGHLRSSVRTEDEAIFDSTRAKIHKNINGMRHMDDDIQLREPVRKEKMSSNILGWPESVEQPPGQVKTPESRILHDLYAPVSQVSASRLVGLTSKQIWTAMVNESENIVHCLLVLISPKRHMALEALINFFDDVWVPESSDNTPLIYELNPTEIFAGNVLHKIVEALFVHNSRFIARTPWIDALADSSFPECLERGRLPDVVDLPKFCPVCNGKIKSTAPGNFRVCSGVSNDHLPLCMEMAILANLTSLVAEGFSPNQEYFDEQHFVCGRFQGDSLPLRESQPQPLEARRHWLAMRIGFTKVVREGHFSRYAALLTAMSVLHNFSHIADVTLYALAIISNETSYTSDFDDKYVMLVPIPFVINSIKFWTDLRKIETRDDSSSSDFVSFDAFHLRTMDDVRRDALGIEGLSVLSEGMSTISMRLCQFKQGEKVTYAPDVLQALDELLLNFSCSHLHSARTEFVSSTALRIWAAATVELALHCSNMLICALTTFVCKVNGSDYFLTSPPGDGLRRLNLDLFCIRYFQYLSLLGRSEHIHTLNISYMSKIMMSIAQHVAGFEEKLLSECKIQRVTEYADAIPKLLVRSWEHVYCASARQADMWRFTEDDMNCMSRISFLWTTRRNVFLPEPWKLEGLFEDDFACTLTDCKSRRAFGLSFEKSCSSCQEDFPSDSYVHSGQAARMNMFVENALTCRQPEHYNRLSFATLDFTWYLDLKHAPGTIVEVYESCQATLNVMPREACVDWISRFLSFIARFTSCLVDSCLDDMDLRTMDFHRKTAALVRLALKESMVMVVTWKAKSSAVAELWVSVVSYLMKLPKSVISLPRLSSRVKKALSYAKKLSCHWPLRKELQFKVILLWLTASAFPISRDESLWRWLSLIEYLHADDVYIVLAIRGLRCRLLEDEKNNSSDVRIHSKSCVCCGRPELGTAHYFILCRDCLRPENFFFETPTHPFSRSPALPQGAVTILIPRSAEDCVGYDCPD